MTATPSDSRPVVAVFDFDGTLTEADSLLPFLREHAGALRFWSKLAVSAPTFHGLASGLLSNHQAKERLLRAFLRGCPLDRLERTAAHYASGRLLELLNPHAMERLRWHREKGHRVILLSASPETYLRPWAAQFDIGEIVGTRLASEHGILTGCIVGENCHGAEKVRRLEDVLGNLSDWHIHAYGDARSDRFVLHAAAEAHYRTFWSRRGWRQKLHLLGSLWRALR